MNVVGKSIGSSWRGMVSTLGTFKYWISFADGWTLLSFRSVSQRLRSTIEFEDIVEQFWPEFENSGTGADLIHSRTSLSSLARALASGPSRVNQSFANDLKPNYQVRRNPAPVNAVLQSSRC